MPASFLSSIDPDADSYDVRFVGWGALPSAYAVTDLAAASVAAAAVATQRLLRRHGHGDDAPIVVDRRLSSLWFDRSLRPLGWEPTPVWDPLAGDHAAADGWIRVHTNAPAHRAAALAVIGSEPTRDAMAKAVRSWSVDDLETAIVEAGGCAAVMRTETEWAEHPQGRAVAAEPIVDRRNASGPARSTALTGLEHGRPLRGIRVLDLTRIIAGPIATRFLAGLGADVLRIDPLDWDEQGVLQETTLGKRCARLDLRTSDGKVVVRRLLAGADIVVHGFRPEALDHLGLDEDARHTLRPGLIDVSLDAYGWSGPWSGRRGFDSLVQMSSGIADTGRRRLGSDKPVSLPVAALDHAAGHLLAAAAIDGLTQRFRTGQGIVARTSLARVAALLLSGPHGSFDQQVEPPTEEDELGGVEHTGWGPGRRLRPPCAIPGVTIEYDYPAGKLGEETHPLMWR